MKEKTVCFSGHRNISFKEVIFISKKLNNVIKNLISKGFCYFGVGGAIGFDTIAALEIIKLRKKYPHIKLIIVLPCCNHSKYWKYRNKFIYKLIEKQADKIVYLSKEYFKGCTLKRNRHLVDYSSICVCYLINNNSGTGYTVNYAKNKNLKIINIAE